MISGQQSALSNSGSVTDNYCRNQSGALKKSLPENDVSPLLFKDNQQVARQILPETPLMDRLNIRVTEAANAISSQAARQNHSVVPENEPPSDHVNAELDSKFAEAVASGSLTDFTPWISKYGINKVANEKLAWTLNIDGSEYVCPEISAFWLACWSGKIEAVKTLIAGKPDLNEKPECINGADDRTPLMAACQKGHVEVVKYLLTHDVDVWCKGSDGYGADALNQFFNANSPDTAQEISNLLNIYRSEHYPGRRECLAICIIGYLYIRV